MSGWPPRRLDLRVHPPAGLEPSDELIRAAQETDAELIVVGLRHRTAVGKLLLGSYAQRVLLEADCPVLAVKASRVEVLTSTSTSGSAPVDVDVSSLR